MHFIRKEKDMKKSKILISLVLACMMLLSACGNGSTGNGIQPPL